MTGEKKSAGRKEWKSIQGMKEVQVKGKGVIRGSRKRGVEGRGSYLWRRKTQNGG